MTTWLSDICHLPVTSHLYTAVTIQFSASGFRPPYFLKPPSVLNRVVCTLCTNFYCPDAVNSIYCNWYTKLANPVRSKLVSNSNKLTKQTQKFYSFIAWRFVSLNMFRALPRPSSGAYNRPLVLHWSVVVAALLVVVSLLPPHSKVKPEVVNAIASSWWWAWGRPKHVERHKTSSNKLVELLHLVG
jgi:hypothetical protein